MPIENAAIRAERRHLRNEFNRGLEEGAEFDKGMDAGYKAATKPLPAWFTTKTLSRLTTYERGFFVGWQLYLMDDGSEA